MSFSFQFVNKTLKETCFTILDLVRQEGGKGYLVGGCVRDALMKIPAKDIDLEIYGLELNKLIRILKEKFALNYVGKNFGIIKLNYLPIDISIPRTEKKVAPGYQGFEITTDHTYNPKEACARRDFTINAILFDLLNNKFIDPFEGQADLKKKILKHTTSKFSEDPLRVLRAMQLIARFDFKIAEESLKLCQQIKIENLSKERIFEEWKKLILKGQKISAGLFFLKDSTWLKYFPELEALAGCPQQKEWHPEGDVFIHTALCMDAFAIDRDLYKDEKENLLVGLGTLCHDLGKPITTKLNPMGKLISHGHDLAGVKPALSFLTRLTIQKNILNTVASLVKYHMIPSQLYRQKAGTSAILKFSNKVENIHRLLRVCKADYNGRGAPYKGEYPAGNWLLEKATSLKVSKSPPKPLLQGRHLIKFGLIPGRQFGKLLDQAYQAQLNGEIKSAKEAILLLEKKELLNNSTAN